MRERPFQLGLALSFLAISSYLLGGGNVFFDQRIEMNRFNNTGILIYMSLLLPLAIREFPGNAELIYRVLVAYVAFTFALSLVFFADPAAYFQLRTIWSYSGETIEVGQLSVLVRYTGILSDPNNMAVMINAVVAILVASKPFAVPRNLALIAACAVITISTMSATGFICLGILISVFILKSDFSSNARSQSLTRAALVLTSAIIAAGLYFAVKDNAVFQLSLERLSQSDAESRFSRWLIVFDQQKILSSIWLGDGGSIIWGASEYKPHNGHLHLMFSYGIAAYLLFVALFLQPNVLKHLSSGIFLWIVLLGFTVNVGIYEPRFSTLWVVLLGFHHAVFVKHVPHHKIGSSSMGRRYRLVEQ